MAVEDVRSFSPHRASSAAISARHGAARCGFRGEPVSDCPFCDRIAAGEFAYSDADSRSVAFQPLNPVTPGHFLVVPRKHVTSALDMPELAGRALEFAADLAAEMGLESCNFITSAGLAATQTVMHLHVHVVPRRDGDGLALPWTGQEATS